MCVCVHVCVCTCVLGLNTLVELPHLSAEVVTTSIDATYVARIMESHDNHYTCALKYNDDTVCYMYSQQSCALNGLHLN